MRFSILFDMLISKQIIMLERSCNQ